MLVAGVRPSLRRRGRRRHDRRLQSRTAGPVLGRVRESRPRPHLDRGAHARPQQHRRPCVHNGRIYHLSGRPHPGRRHVDASLHRRRHHLVHSGPATRSRKPTADQVLRARTPHAGTILERGGSRPDHGRCTAAGGRTGALSTRPDPMSFVPVEQAPRVIFSVAAAGAVVIGLVDQKPPAPIWFTFTASDRQRIAAFERRTTLDPADHRGQPAGEVVDGRRVLAGQAQPGLLDHILGSARTETSSGVCRRHRRSHRVRATSRSVEVASAGNHSTLKPKSAYQSPVREGPQESARK